MRQIFTNDIGNESDNESDGNIKYTYGNFTIHYVIEYGLFRTARKLSIWFSFD